MTITDGITDNKASMKWRAEGRQNPLETLPALREAALDAFSTGSFAEASLNDMLKAAEIHKGSFYHRFYDKLDLYLSLFDRLGAEKLALFQSEAVSGTSPARADEAGFFASMRRMAILGLRFAGRAPRYQALYRRFLSESADFREQVYRHFGATTQAVLLDMVVAAQNAGHLRSDTPAPLLADVIALVLERVDRLIAPDMPEEAMLDQLDALLAILRDGMLPIRAATHENSTR